MKHEFEFDVFLSHSSGDKVRVRRLAERLRDAGLKVWFDEWSIAPGDDIYLAIERGLEVSRTQLLCLSPAALGSDWVGLERSTALFRDPTNKVRRFVPLLLEDCQLPDTLKRYRYIDLRRDTKAAFAELLAAITGGDGSAAPAPPPAPPANPPSKKPPVPRKERQAPAGALPGALLAAVSFVAGLVVLWVMLARAELLTRLGLTGQLFYVLLLPLGMSAAAFLFGALRSYARFRGQAFGGALELGGPVVAFGLVVLGGFLLAPPTVPFGLTVFVHGAGDRQELPLRGVGAVLLDLGSDRRREPIGPNGEARFVGIPATFHGHEVAIGLDAEGFALSEGSRRVRLDGDAVYVEAQPLPVALRGRVVDKDGRPVPGATLQLGKVEAVSRADGIFELEVPGELARGRPTLRVQAPGFEPWQAEVVPGSNDVDVLLRREAP